MKSAKIEKPTSAESIKSWDTAESIRCIVQDPESIADYLDNIGYSCTGGFSAGTNISTKMMILSVIASTFISTRKYALLNALSREDRSTVLEIIIKNDYEHGADLTDVLISEVNKMTKEITELRETIAAQRKELLEVRTVIPDME